MFAIQSRKALLSTLWIFIVLNYLYADVLIILGDVAPTTAEEAEAVAAMSTPGMMLLAAIYLELAMIMAVLPRVLKHGINRWANIIIATVHILGGLGSLFVMAPPIYLFFVVVEVIALLFIIRYAWTWEPEHA